MKITRLVVKIEPVGPENSQRMWVEVRSYGTIYSVEVPFWDTDIESRFDQMFEMAKKKLLKKLKEGEICLTTNPKS